MFQFQDGIIDKSDGVGNRSDVVGWGDNFLMWCNVCETLTE